MEKEQIYSKIEEIVASLGYFLIDLNIRGDSHMRIIEVYIDNEKGITPLDCSLVSSAVNQKISEEKIIDENYRLNISSPGVERSLKYLLQYHKHFNRKLEVHYKYGEETKKLTGKLMRLEGDDLFFESSNAEVKINFQNIITAKVLISF